MSADIRFSVSPGGRRFATFEAAEAYARGLVKAGVSAPRETKILSAGICFATIDRDAYDRIWTDVVQDNLV